MKHPILSLLSKITFSSSILLLSTASFANGQYPNYKGEANYKNEVPVDPVYSCMVEMELKDGPYLGAGLGYESYKVNQDFNAIDGLGNTFVLNPSLALKGWSGNLFGGYGLYFNWFYMGGELGVSGSSADSSNNTSVNLFTMTQKFRVHQSYSAAILPGIKVNDFALVYARLGYTRTAFKITEEGNIANFDVYYNNHSRWLNGFTYGIGIETAIYENTSVRAEYTYTNYGSFNSDLSRYSPNDNKFTMTVNYHFPCFF